MQPWTKELPERVEYERAEMLRRAPALKVDERALSSHGRLLFNGPVDVDGTQVHVTVVYPDCFPYLRPEVFAQGLQLPRHQNPYSGNLCLLDRSSREWNPSDTGAWLIAERLPYLLRLLRKGGDALAQAEAPQGEPVTSYFASEAGAAIFIPSEATRLQQETQSGTIEIACGAGEQFAPRLRGCLTRVAVKDQGAKRSVAVADSQLAARFAGPRLSGVWRRLHGTPATRDAQGLMSLAAAEDSRLSSPRWQPISQGEIALVGLVVDEEVQQGTIEDAWLFVVRWRQRSGRGTPESVYVIRGERLTPQDLGARIPGLRGLPAKRVAQAGAGALGAPLALELARAQVGDLAILDHDAVEAGNIVRWPVGLSAVGHAKTDVLAGLVRQDYPYTTVKGYRQQIGVAAPPGAEGPGEAATLSAFLAGADVLIDATAEIGVGQLLAHLAEAAGLPFLTLWATEGAWGGAVASIPPGGEGCWQCLQLAIADGTLPAPPFEPGGPIQPRGCATRTFTGTGYDALEIVTQALRVTRRVLLEPALPHSTLDVCALRDADGRELAVPQWVGHTIERHPGCVACRAYAAA
jgi:hypothetical protein